TLLRRAVAASSACMPRLTHLYQICHQLTSYLTHQVQPIYTLRPPRSVSQRVFVCRSDVTETAELYLDVSESRHPAPSGHPDAPGCPRSVGDRLRFDPGAHR